MPNPQADVGECTAAKRLTCNQWVLRCRGIVKTCGPACHATCRSPPSDSSGRSMNLPFLNTALARTNATRWGALTARHRVCADSMSLKRHRDTGGAGAGALGDSLAKPELARKFHDNTVRSLPEERAGEDRA